MEIRVYRCETSVFVVTALLFNKYFIVVVLALFLYLHESCKIICTLQSADSTLRGCNLNFFYIVFWCCLKNEKETNAYW